MAQDNSKLNVFVPLPVPDTESSLTGRAQMNDRTLFIQHEIGCMQIDDFMNLPTTPIVGRVVEPVSSAYARHDSAFKLTH